MEWQPIETAPRDGTEIITMYIHIETQIVNNSFWLYDEENDSNTGWWSYTISETSRTLLTDWYTPTHWMPLPPPPKEQS